VKHVHRHGQRIAVETVSTATPVRERKPFNVSFVKFYDYWIKRLEQSKNPGTFKLFLRILKADFKRQITGGELVLSTEATGLSRKVRSRAIRELVELGLIEIEQNGNQAVRVTKLILL
jgi:predicted transcriptional regulator